MGHHLSIAKKPNLTKHFVAHVPSEHEGSYSTAEELVFLISCQLAAFACLFTGQNEVGHSAYVYLQDNGCQGKNIALHPPEAKVFSNVTAS